LFITNYIDSKFVHITFQENFPSCPTEEVVEAKVIIREDQRNETSERVIDNIKKIQRKTAKRL
jgi:hypothetical protein